MTQPLFIWLLKVVNVSPDIPCPWGWHQMKMERYGPKDGLVQGKDLHLVKKNRNSKVGQNRMKKQNMRVENYTGFQLSWLPTAKQRPAILSLNRYRTERQQSPLLELSANAELLQPRPYPLLQIHLPCPLKLGLQQQQIQGSSSRLQSTYPTSPQNFPLNTLALLRSIFWPPLFCFFGDRVVTLAFKMGALDLNHQPSVF